MAQEVKLCVLLQDEQAQLLVQHAHPAATITATAAAAAAGRATAAAAGRAAVEPGGKRMSLDRNTIDVAARRHTWSCQASSMWSC